RRAQAVEVPPAVLQARQRALPPPTRPDRLQPASDGRLLLRVDAAPRRSGACPPVHPVLRPPRAPSYGVVARDVRARPGRRGGEPETGLLWSLFWRWLPDSGNYFF